MCICTSSLSTFAAGNFINKSGYGIEHREKWTHVFFLEVNQKGT